MGGIDEGELERACPACDARTVGTRPIVVCSACGVAFSRSVEHGASGLPPEGVRVEEPVLVECEGDPYREPGGSDDTLMLVVSHESRPLLARMSILAVSICVIALQLDVAVLGKLTIAALGLAVFVAGLAPRRTNYRLVAGRDGITAGAEGVPVHRCVQIRREEIEAVLARAVARTTDPTALRFDLLVVDTEGRLRRLLASLEGAERAVWIATRLRDATQPRAIDDES